MGIILKNKDQIEGIRESCTLAAETLDMIAPHVVAGVSTAQLNKLIDQYVRDNGAIPATVGYRGYKYASCISINDVVCHGVPSEQVLIQDGDILNIDVTTILDGFYGDTSRMYQVGAVPAETKMLVDVAKKCLDIGIKQCYPGNRIGNIGYEIARYAHAMGYSVVHEFCGHGVGLRFHEEPEVSHIADKDTGAVMRPGMVFTIEPMINQGKPRTKVDRADGWTARTIDGSLSAQWEHTVLVTRDGVEVLTDIHQEYPKPLVLA
ncbi:MAG: type I methionyl aminopeptidase [Bacteroidetes bacterium]|nr:type I methionyl aminopeptidase [Bacteroidota bacterium]